MIVKPLRPMEPLTRRLDVIAQTMHPGIRRTALALGGRVLILAALIATLAACGGGTSAAHRSTTGTTATNASNPPTTPAPTGLPQDWSALAIRAATVGLENCARADSLMPRYCPQQIAAPQSGNQTLAVHWTLLDAPLADAVAVPGAPTTDSAATNTGGQVTVYGLYQMEVSYTTAGQTTRPYLDYDGGVASATMTWDGTSFQNVQFTPANQAQLPANVHVGPFNRSADATDADALALVKAGFQTCVHLKMPVSAATLPDCPQSSFGLDVYTVSASWLLNGDPMQGALVSFDTQHGNFAVTGSFDMNLNSVVNDPGHPGYGPNGPHTARSYGNYTAVLAWDGHRLGLLTITTR
jgi:hypothetical protein